MTVSLVLLQEDHKRHDFYREQTVCIADRGPVLQDGLEELIQDKLVAAAKHLIEGLQFRDLVEDNLGCGGKSTAHMLKQYRLSGWFGFRLKSKRSIRNGAQGR